MKYKGQKEVTVTTQEGEEKVFLFHKFHALAGREIMAKYALSNLPKVGDYGVSEEVALKLMAYVAVQTPNGPLFLTTRALVDNHIPDWETHLKIEGGMLEYNASFFGNGKALAFFKKLREMVQASTSQTSTHSSRQSSEKSTPHSKS